MRRKKIDPTSEVPAAVHPGKPDVNERETVIMFVDIMGASEVSNHMSPEAYATFVNRFQKLFMDVCAKYIKAWYPTKEEQNEIQYSARGDEGLLMIYRKETRNDPTVDIDVAVNIALELKRQWLCSPANADRIKDGLLPIDLGIGIHVGRTYIDKEEKKVVAPGNPGGLKLEGYAINLAKRVESHSRQGRFSHILLSEAAHGLLNYLADERTYLFDSPQVISPKGISRDIRVYEVKHHFLVSDWTVESKKSRRARTLLDPESVNMEVLEGALEINPTNLWLTEECIRSSMLKSYNDLPEADREDSKKLQTAFRDASEKADRLAQGHQRDAGVLFIQGLIEGESARYKRERELYEEAIKFPEKLAEAYWYKGQSLSSEIWEVSGKKLNVAKDELEPKELSELVDEAIDSLREATQRRSQAAWMLYDYGCELIRWAKSQDERDLGIQQIELAVCRLPDDVLEKIPEEPYLKTVQSNPRIKQLLSSK